MRRYITIAQILLSLSIINFALAAPVAHEVHEGNVNVMGVAEDGTVATLQKRSDSGPRDDWDQTSAPTTLPLLDVEHPGSHSPRSKIINAPSSPALPTGPHPRTDDGPPRPSSWSPSYSPIPWVSGQSFTQAGTSSPSYSHPSWLSIDYSPPNSIDNTVLSSPDYSPESSESTADSHPSGSRYLPSSSKSPRPTGPKAEGFIGQLGAQRGPSSPADSAEVVEPETKNFLSQLGAQRGPSSPAEVVAPEIKNFLGQLDTSPRPPSPSNPETKDFISQLGPWSSLSAESETKDLLGLFSKGKMKRRISGSNAVNSARESPATIDPRWYVLVPSLSPANLKSAPGP